MGLDPHGNTHQLETEQTHLGEPQLPSHITVTTAEDLAVRGAQCMLFPPSVSRKTRFQVAVGPPTSDDLRQAAPGGLRLCSSCLQMAIPTSRVVIR